MKFRKLIAMAACGVMAVSLLAGCGGGSSGSDAAATSSAASSASEAAPEAASDTGSGSGRDDVKIQIFEEPPTADCMQDASVSTGMVAMNIYGYLTRLNENGEVEGELAESWEWNDDYTSLKLKLRDGIKFSDGSDITAEDVVYSLERGKGFGFSTYFAYIDSVTADSDTEVTINLTQPYTVYPACLASCYFAIMSKKAIEEDGMDTGKVVNVTSGPYYIDQWNTGSDIVLKANEYYYEGAPAIKTADIIFMSDENTALTALQSGDVDFIVGINGLTGSAASQIEADDSLALINFDSTAYNFLALNQDVEYFADENVRKAIDCAINRDDIIAVAMDGNGVPANIPVIEGIGGYVEGYETTAYDVEKAKEYLAASNYPDGFSFTILSGSEQWKKAATTIQSELAEIGITVNIEEEDIGALISDLSSGNYEGGIVSWANANGDATNLVSMFRPDDPMCLCRTKDPTIADAYDESVTLVDEARLEPLKKAYDYFMETVPYISLYWPSASYASSKDLSMDGVIGIVGEFYIRNMHWS